VQSHLVDHVDVQRIHCGLLGLQHSVRG
jgi:hypothetical protein